jgi:hypothetical protein
MSPCEEVASHGHYTRLLLSWRRPRAQFKKRNGDTFMRSADGGYDSELQMFCEIPREASMTQLRFLRWLAERGHLEHEAFGPPSGEYADAPPAGELATAEEI